VSKLQTSIIRVIRSETEGIWHRSLETSTNAGREHPASLFQAQFDFSEVRGCDYCGFVPGRIDVANFEYHCYSVADRRDMASKFGNFDERVFFVPGGIKLCLKYYGNGWLTPDESHYTFIFLCRVKNLF
jgi:hypothetical protein